MFYQTHTYTHKVSNPAAIVEYMLFTPRYDWLLISWKQTIVSQKSQDLDTVHSQKGSDGGNVTRGASVTG